MSKEDFTKFEWIMIIAWSIFIMSLIYFSFRRTKEPEKQKEKNHYIIKDKPRYNGLIPE